MCHARLGETDKAKECYQRAKRRRAEISEKLPPAWAVELDEFQAEVNSCSTHGTRKGNDERRMTRPVKDPTAGRSSEDWMLQINIRQPKASRWENAAVPWPRSGSLLQRAALRWGATAAKQPLFSPSLSVTPLGASRPLGASALLGREHCITLAVICASSFDSRLRPASRFNRQVSHPNRQNMRAVRKRLQPGTTASRRAMHPAGPRKAELVVLRFFAGMTIPEVAKALGVSVPTAERWWAYARTWLYADLESENSENPARQDRRSRPCSQYNSCNFGSNALRLSTVKSFAPNSPRRKINARRIVRSGSSSSRLTITLASAPNGERRWSR